jgi:hypothetical protein
MRQKSADIQIEKIHKLIRDYKSAENEKTNASLVTPEPVGVSAPVEQGARVPERRRKV